MIAEIEQELEEQATPEQIHAEQIRVEHIRLSEMMKALNHAMNTMYANRDDSIRDTNGQNEEWYDNLERLYSSVYNSIEGRMQELDPYYCGNTRRMKEARENGINYIALQGLSTEEFSRAVKYIAEHGLASMNYETTRKALNEFFRYELDESINARSELPPLIEVAASYFNEDCVSVNIPD